LDENIVYNSEEDDSEENEEEIDKENDEYNYEKDAVPTKKASEDQPIPCVVMINLNGTIQCCRQINLENQRRLWNLIGTWEVDMEAVNEMKERTDRLGVCTTHFHYDQNNLHPKGLKQASFDTFAALYARNIFAHSVVLMGVTYIVGRLQAIVFLTVS
jgi:hypothetical protein